MHFEDRASWLSISLVVFTLLILVAHAGAGNAWNPPLLAATEEQQFRRIGAEFLRLQSVIYSLLALLEVKNLVDARQMLPQVQAQTERATRQCRLVSGKLRENTQIARIYDVEVARSNAKTKAYVAAGVIQADDPTWGAVVKGGYASLTALCQTTIGNISSTLEPIVLAVRSGSEPETNQVWRLLNAVETGSKRARYFTMVLR